MTTSCSFSRASWLLLALCIPTSIFETAYQVQQHQQNPLGIERFDVVTIRSGAVHEHGLTVRWLKICFMFLRGVSPLAQQSRGGLCYIIGSSPFAHF